MEALVRPERRTSMVRVHLKIDSGMGRYGFLPEQLEGIAQTMTRNPHIVVEGCFTHLARGEEEPAGATSAQLRVYRDALTALRRHGIEPALQHVANSGAILAAPNAHFNMARCGLLLYGYHPSAGGDRLLALKQVMEVHSTLARCGVPS